MYRQFSRILTIIVLTTMLFIPASPAYASSTNELRVCGVQSSYLHNLPYPNAKTFGYWGPLGYFTLHHDQYENDACHTVSTSLWNGTFNISQVIETGWDLMPSNTVCYGSGVTSFSYDTSSQTLTVSIAGSNTDNVCLFTSYNTAIGFH